MKIAIPLAAGRLSMHFGHCDEFALFDVDPEAKAIVGRAMLRPPDHEPGSLPRWLRENAVKVVLAGGMGMRAQQLLARDGITVVVGAPAGEPEALVQDFLDQKLEAGENICDH